MNLSLPVLAVTTKAVELGAALLALLVLGTNGMTKVRLRKADRGGGD